jgi:DNA-binding MarR family transcriptional regulator
MKNKALRRIFDSAVEISKLCFEQETLIAKSFGLTCIEAKILLELCKSRSIKKSDLLKKFNFSAGRLTHLLISMEEKKLAKRKVNEDDSREIIIEITEEGKKIAKKINHKCETYYLKLSSFANDQNLIYIAETLENLVAELQNASK